MYIDIHVCAISMTIRNADSLWIETEKMTGGSKNQLEFSENLSPFFSYSGSLPGEIDINFKGSLYSGRPVSSRTTDPPYEVPMCLVYLPTGFDYAHKIIHFEKLSSNPATTPQVELKVASHGDNIIDDWRESSRRMGEIGETNGDREYGYY